MVWSKRACLLRRVQADSKQMRAKCKGRCAEVKNVAIFPLLGSSSAGRNLGITSGNPICLQLGFIPKRSSDLGCQKGRNVEFMGCPHYPTLQAAGCVSQLIPLGCFCRQWREGDALGVRRIQSRLSELVREMLRGPICSSKGPKGHEEPAKSSCCRSQADRLFLPDCKPGTASKMLGGTTPKGCC